jgi:hypothetical protein
MRNEHIAKLVTLVLNEIVDKDSPEPYEIGFLTGVEKAAEIFLNHDEVREVNTLMEKRVQCMEEKKKREKEEIRKEYLQKHPPVTFKQYWEKINKENFDENEQLVTDELGWLSPIGNIFSNGTPKEEIWNFLERNFEGLIVRDYLEGGILHSKEWYENLEYKFSVPGWI